MGDEKKEEKKILGLDSGSTIRGEILRMGTCEEDNSVILMVKVTQPAEPYRPEHPNDYERETNDEDFKNYHRDLEAYNLKLEISQGLKGMIRNLRLGKIIIHQGRIE